MGHSNLGFSVQRTGDSSNAKINITIPHPYKVELQSLFLLIPQHFNLLRSTSTPLTAEESRKRILKKYATVPFEELAAYATEVFKHKQAKLPGKPSTEQWAAELELWKKEHNQIQKGY
jgi:hypothetical protein